MIHDTVWTSVAEKKNTLLCVGCIETRLGRMLTPDDFMFCMLNLIPGSARLRDRIGNKYDVPLTDAEYMQVTGMYPMHTNGLTYRDMCVDNMPIARREDMSCRFTRVTFQIS